MPRFVAIAAVLAVALLIVPPLWHLPRVKTMSIALFVVLLGPRVCGMAAFAKRWSDT